MLGGGGWPAGAGVSRLTTVRERNYWKFRDANALLLLLFLFDCGTNLGNDIGAEPRGYSEQSRCDLPCALDGEGLGAEPLAAKAYDAPVPDLALDEKTERFLVHSGLAGSGGRERTPNSPGSRRPEAPTRKARCRRREGSTKLDAPGSARTRRVRVRQRTERDFMSRTDPTALTDALFAQRSLTRRAIQASGPAVFSVEGPATAALGR